jgi:RNA methyltransferase, TrmH family
MLSKEKIKHIRKLHDKKWRSESWLFLVEGRKMILELLASDWKEQIEELFVSEKLFDELEASFPDQGKQFKRDLCIADEETLSKISTLENNSDGVAIVRQIPLSQPFPQGEKGVNCNSWTLVLDGIRDPGNMGTILRTASWFGAERIICSEDSVELYNPKVVSATMGALFHLNISSQNLENFYKNNAFPVYAAELGGTNITEIAFPKSWVLVMGSESHGISEVSRKYMTQGILIPKIGFGESLNVAIATGIILSQLSKY